MPAAAVAERRQVLFYLSPAMRTNKVIYARYVLKERFARNANPGVNNIY